MKFHDIDSKEKLLQFIRENETNPDLLRFCEWIISQEQERFYAPQVGIKIQEMIRNWSIRLSRMEMHGTVAAGLRELIERMKLRPLEERISGVSFSSSSNFFLSIVATPNGEYLGFNRMVPSSGIFPEEFVRLERLATSQNSLTDERENR